MSIVSKFKNTEPRYRYFKPGSGSAGAFTFPDGSTWRFLPGVEIPAQALANSVEVDEHWCPARDVLTFDPAQYEAITRVRPEVPEPVYLLEADLQAALGVTDEQWAILRPTFMDPPPLKNGQGQLLWDAATVPAFRAKLARLVAAATPTVQVGARW